VDWKGETQLAVPTADGVKEPLNRRSTIDINF
jgi:outer membrane protein OmpA-like peptidoglycan-associated protein